MKVVYRWLHTGLHPCYPLPYEASGGVASAMSLVGQFRTYLHGYKAAIIASIEG